MVTCGCGVRLWRVRSPTRLGRRRLAAKQRCAFGVVPTGAAQNRSAGRGEREMGGGAVSTCVSMGAGYHLMMRSLPVSEQRKHGGGGGIWDGSLVGSWGRGNHSRTTRGERSRWKMRQTARFHHQVCAAGTTVSAIATATTPAPRVVSSCQCAFSATHCDPTVSTVTKHTTVTKAKSKTHHRAIPAVLSRRVLSG